MSNEHLHTQQIDSAPVTKNKGCEAACGKAITASSIPREQIFFTSKVPSGVEGYEGTKAQIEDTLSKTGLDYIDLTLLHSPYLGSENRKGSWKALVEAVEAGKIRSIGVSNYGVHHLDELEQHIAELEQERGGKGKGGVISVNQCEVHPYCTRKDIIEWCTKRGIAVEAYCSLVEGQRWGEPATMKLAEKYGKTEAQILIKWSLAKGLVPLPKSATSSRIRENADVYDFELTPEEVDALETDEYYFVSWDPTTAELDE